MPHVGRWLARQRGLVVFLLSVFNGVVVTSLLIVVTTPELRAAWSGFFGDPGHAVTTTAVFLSGVFGAMLKGAVVDPDNVARAFAYPSWPTVSRALTPLANTVTAAAPLAIAGVGLAVAFRAGVFNIGSIAQVVAGGIGASLVGFSLPGLPWLPHVLLALAAAAVAGALCGCVPGTVKAFTGGSEVIVTIMMNYIMSLVLTFLLTATFFRAGKGDVAAPVGRKTVESAALGNLVPGLPVNAGVFLAVGCVLFVAVLMNRSKLGYELQVAGFSRRAASLAGIEGKRVVVTAFAISGAVVGLAGAVQVLGVSRQLTTTFGVEVGTLSLLVAFVGANRPLAIGLAALLFGAMQSGGVLMQFTSGTSYQLTAVIQAIIVMFVTAPSLVAALYRLRALAPGATA